MSMWIRESITQATIDYPIEVMFLVFGDLLLVKALYLFFPTTSNQ